MLLRTPLHATHLAMGAKLCLFAGYEMPIQYPEGILKEHLWVRASAGLFDVSHMGQLWLEGPGMVTLLEQLTPSAFASLPVGTAKYTVLLSPEGGILDDLIVTRMGEERFFVVVNAGRKTGDMAWIREHLSPAQQMDYLETQALIALQGPEAAASLQPHLTLDLATLPYMQARETQLTNGTDILISRTGYTGEDGFEISLPGERAESFWKTLLANPQVHAIGLGARDSLRLEMGYPLYGQDIDTGTSPVEAALGWVIGKERDSYYGADRIRRERAEGITRKRVGIRVSEGIARSGAALLNAAGEAVGTLTSGGFSPSLSYGIGQGYVATAYAKPDTALQVEVRGNRLPVTVMPLSFVQARTVKG
jgi:aminomethyltransferase